MSGKVRLIVVSAALSLMVSQQAHAGAVCEAIGKGWDKAVGKMVKAHEACQAQLKDAMHKGAKLKAGKKAGGCKSCR